MRTGMLLLPSTSCNTFIVPPAPAADSIRHHEPDSIWRADEAVSGISEMAAGEVGTGAENVLQKMCDHGAQAAVLVCSTSCAGVLNQLLRPDATGLTR